ncbi:hypothetical protein GQ457_02G005290 [Hibiscus cannabinus]
MVSRKLFSFFNFSRIIIEENKEDEINLLYSYSYCASFQILVLFFLLQDLALGIALIGEAKFWVGRFIDGRRICLFLDLNRREIFIVHRITLFC